jgi:hypothetical protein
MGKKGKGGRDGKASGGVSVSEATLVRITKVLKDFCTSDAEGMLYSFPLSLSLVSFVALLMASIRHLVTSDCSLPLFASFGPFVCCFPSAPLE